MLATILYFSKRRSRNPNFSTQEFAGNFYILLALAAFYIIIYVLLAVFRPLMSHYLSSNLTNACMNASCCAIMVAKSLKDYQAFRISPGDTNKLAIIFDSATVNVSLTVCVEIFDVGGKTPPNTHQTAVEMFFILQGEGKAICDGKTVAIKAGDSLLVPPTGTHVIENTGFTRLYALCIMVPNEDFTELIRSGIPVDLDEEDIAVLCRNC